MSKQQQQQMPLRQHDKQQQRQSRQNQQRPDRRDVRGISKQQSDTDEEFIYTIIPQKRKHPK